MPNLASWLAVILCMSSQQWGLSPEQIDAMPRLKITVERVSLSVNVLQIRYTLENMSKEEVVVDKALFRPDLFRIMYVCRGSPFHFANDSGFRGGQVDSDFATIQPGKSISIDAMIGRVKVVELREKWYPPFRDSDKSLSAAYSCYWVFRCHRPDPKSRVSYRIEGHGTTEVGISR